MPGPIRSIHSRHAHPVAARGAAAKCPPRHGPQDLFQSRPLPLDPGIRLFGLTPAVLEAGRAASTVDELLEAGNLDLPDARSRDYAAWRNDRKLGRRVLRSLRREVLRIHQEASGRPAPEFREWLRSPEGRPERRRMAGEIRRLVTARYVQGHGLKIPRDLPAKDLAVVRDYVQSLDTAYDVVDAAASLNEALARGGRDGERLTRASEQALYLERGVPEDEFRAGPPLPVRDLRSLRRFADGWAPSAAGRTLRHALRQGDPDLGALQAAMATHLLEGRGFALPQPPLERRTLLSLLRDLDSEGPRSARAFREAVNGALARGERSYLALTMEANLALLDSLGVPRDLAEGGGDREARAERLRHLRDLMYSLPKEDRARACAALVEQGASLADFQAPLETFLKATLRTLAGPRLGARLARRGLQSAANTVAALRNLPKSVRGGVFEGLQGSPARRETEAVDRLEEAMQARFGIALHRTRGVFPREGTSKTYSRYVRDFPLQAAAEVYGALDRMSPGGRVPPGLAGTTTVVFMAGTPPAPAGDPGTYRGTEGLAEPYDRPGEASQVSGKSGYLGEAFQDDEGRDLVVYFDDSLYQPSSDGTPGVSGGEGTMLHEIAHAVQLGGEVGASPEARRLEDRRRTAEWSSLSVWQEADGALADSFEGDFSYYYDPSVRVRHREEVATSYGASDPSEDLAEVSPFFFTDPAVAMELSPEKFLYFNQLVGDRYDPDQVWAVAREAGVPPSRLARAGAEVQRRVGASWDQARQRPGHREPAV